jgi:DUF1680 family protein
MKQKYESLSFGQIKPSGWIYNQMNNDLTKGFVGRLDEIVPSLIKEDDIYGRDRLTKKYKVKNLGVAEGEVEGSLQLQWWNSETQSNWYDGLVRNTMLLDNEKYNEKVVAYIERILATQDEDGYLGIYEKDLRYKFDFEGGELWAQSTLFRSLLGYYESSKDERVLTAVIKAIGVTMKSYPIGKSTPFKFEQSHGLTIIDTLETLYRLTCNKNYIEYAVWLYDDFSLQKVGEKDAKLNNLLDEEYLFSDHGAHTYEHLRAVVTSYYATNEDKYKKALDGYLNKLDKCISPSGGPIGDEWVGKRTADASMTGYEYCSIHELLNSYSLLLNKSGDMVWADRMEWLLFNAGQGARHPRESSIAYLKSDNSYSMEGTFQYHQENSQHKVQTRYKYSPSHQDAAVCCVPNAGRIYPYYLQSMWMKSEKGLVKTLYGPSVLKTKINGIDVVIEEVSRYPFDGKLTFDISLSEPCEFELAFRKPKWCTSCTVNANDIKISPIETDDLIIINKIWKKENELQINFTFGIKENTDFVGNSYLSYGPLVFALELDSEEKIVKQYNLPAFRDLYYSPKNNVPNELSFNDSLKDSFSIETIGFNEKNPWRRGLVLKGVMHDKINNQFDKVKLVPMGGTILRKVTFEKDIILD